MSEIYPVHIMLRPESLAHPEFGDYIRQKLEVIEANTPHQVLRTTLTREEVDLIYPVGSILPELREQLAQEETEHHMIMSTDPDIYKKVKAIKGKWGMPGTVRGELSAMAATKGITLERWSNFLHAGDDEKEVVGICSHFGGEESACQSCVARENCQNCG